ncbi:hypothetical protein HanHA300_Chr10g0378281 [Helianthus annuus]|nr:hypothetical protein HanHA300_Chr10g0378281 [Helianthus annuus]KAJ0531415.1 hypothetical protein HanHA89_Chr10g0400831 [Helianthus annuus]KAJ0698258.1 hypothetical protein HanLR1_Chr10g0378071 [Helianthus annuus]KAJ0701625.1 hypothetical protein HanOQP8_Chr10g0381411 [Helianthus annuus]
MTERQRNQAVVVSSGGSGGLMLMVEESRRRWFCGYDQSSTLPICTYVIFLKIYIYNENGTPVFLFTCLKVPKEQKFSKVARDLIFHLPCDVESRLGTGGIEETKKASCSDELMDYRLTLLLLALFKKGSRDANRIHIDFHSHY